MTLLELSEATRRANGAGIKIELTPEGPFLWMSDKAALQLTWQQILREPLSFFDRELAWLKTQAA